MASGLQLGINQFSIQFDLKPATIRWDQGQSLDLWLEFFDKFSRQTDGAIGIVSNSAVGYFDIGKHLFTFDQA